MEVKMQYITSLDQVLKEVKSLFPSIASWEYELNTSRTYLDKGEIEVVLSIIHSLRKSMYHTDQRLADCQAILNGYMAAQKASEHTKDTPKDTQNDIDVSDLEGMIQESEDTLKILEQGEKNDSDG
jgi:hypothetical protein